MPPATSAHIVLGICKVSLCTDFGYSLASLINLMLFATGHSRLYYVRKRSANKSSFCYARFGIVWFITNNIEVLQWTSTIRTLIQSKMFGDLIQVFEKRSA